MASLLTTEHQAALGELARLVHGDGPSGPGGLDVASVEAACDAPYGMGARMRALCQLGGGLGGRVSADLSSSLGRAAVQAGATLRQIGHVSGLAIMLGGMITYREAGRVALRAASEELGLRLDDWPDGGIDVSSGIATLEGAQEYAASYYGAGQVLAEFERLSAYAPAVFTGYMSLRSSVYADGAQSGLAAHERELIVVAIECSARKKNPPPRWHAERALRDGASPTHLAQAVACAYTMAGLASFVDSGRHALQPAWGRGR